MFVCCSHIIITFAQTKYEGMNIIDCERMMVNGVAAQKDVKMEFTPGKYFTTVNTIILIVGQGSMMLEIDFVKYELRRNSILTVSPLSTVSCLAMSDDFLCSFVTYDHDFAVEVMVRPEPAYMDFIRNYPAGTIDNGRFDDLNASIGNVAYFLYDNKGSHRAMIAKNIVQAILMECYDVVIEKFMPATTTTMTRQNELFVEFIHLVFEYGAKEREVAFYADKLCITPRYLSKIVHNISNETAKDIINRHCIQEIKTLLRSTNDSLQSISLQLEFPDQSFFTRYFKKLAGMTPKEFRAAVTV